MNALPNDREAITRPMPADDVRRRPAARSLARQLAGLRRHLVAIGRPAEASAVMTAEAYLADLVEPR